MMAVSVPGWETREEAVGSARSQAGTLESSSLSRQDGDISKTSCLETLFGTWQPVSWVAMVTRELWGMVHTRVGFTYNCPELVSFAPLGARAHTAAPSAARLLHTQRAQGTVMADFTGRHGEP